MKKGAEEDTGRDTWQTLKMFNRYCKRVDLDRSACGLRCTFLLDYRILIFVKATGDLCFN